MPPSQRPSPTRKPRRLRRWLVAIAASVAVFFGGYAAGQSRPLGAAARNGASSATADGAPTDISKDVDFPLFWEVWKTVKSGYVKQPVKDVDLFHGAIAGVVAALDDPYSVYLEPSLAEEFAKDLQGTFEGIGAEIGIKGNVITVIAPLPDTPASRAGLRAGDKIIAIGDRSTLGMTVEEAVNLIRGKGGTIVTLTVLRNGTREPFKLDIKREKITVKSVRYETKKTKSGATVGYIEIRQFNDDTVPLFDRAVREVMKEDPKGVVIDLRNDPGGYLESATQVAGAWIDGAAVIERRSDGTESPVAAKGTKALQGVKTVVLVNEGSASGSEILAGALQDAGAATLVGKKTFGKGSVQDYQELRDGGALKLTVAEWLTPKKRSINKEGIAPDVEVDLTEENANADQDPQLDKALELIDGAAAAEAAGAR